MTVIDASVLIGFIAPDDPHHDAAGEVMRLLADGPRVIHAVTLAEALVEPARQGHAEALHNDLVSRYLRVVGTDAGSPLRLARLRAQTGLRLPDCCVVDLAEQEGSALASFDRRLVSVAGSRGIEVVADPT